MTLKHKILLVGSGLARYIWNRCVPSVSPPFVDMGQSRAMHFGVNLDTMRPRDRLVQLMAIAPKPKGIIWGLQYLRLRIKHINRRQIGRGGYIHYIEAAHQSMRIQL